MRENEFENQVRKLMDEFHLPPSASVWEQIKSRIIQRRRRWPLVALLLLSMLGTGYVIYTQFGRNRAEVANTEKNNAAEKIPAKPKQDEASKQDNTLMQQPDQNKNNNITETKNPNDIIISLKRPVEDILVSKPLYQKNITDANSSQLNKIEPEEELQKNNNEGNKEIVSAQTASGDSTVTKDVMADLNTTIINKADTTAQLAVRSTTPQQAAPDTQKNKLPVATKKLSKLSVGIIAYGGRSNTVENLFNIDLSKNTPRSNYTLDPLASAATHPKKPFTPSYAYKFGGFVEKNISSKNSLSLGVNYMYFSTKAQITYANPSYTLAVPGLRGATEYISSYYRPGVNKLQVNKYNFVGLDAGFHQSLMSNKKISLRWDAGISVIRLLSTNTLIYDNNTNAYYYKNDWLSKTQASFNTALSLHVKMSNNNSLFVGPEMNYGFTNLLKNKNYTPQHLFSYGLKVGWVIGKK